MKPVGPCAASATAAKAPVPTAVATALAVALPLLAACGNAAAAGFQLFEHNASGLGLAFAGQAAVAEDASVIHFNPANLTRLPGRQVTAALSLIQPSSQFHDGGSCAPYAGTGVGTTSCPFGANGNLGHATGGTGGRASTLGVVPAGYASWELRPNRLWVGVGLNVPFGLTVKRDGDWIGRFHGIDSETQTININPTVAWKVNERVSLGFGVSAQYFSAKLSNSVSYRAAALGSGNAQVIAAVPAGSEGVATIEGNSWGWGWNAGLGIKATDTLHVGLSYRSAVKHKLEGDVNFSGRPAALGAAAALADGGIDARVKLPDTVSVALAWQALPQLQLVTDWSRTNWSTVQDLNIIRTDGAASGQTLTSLQLKFKDSWRFGVGASYQLNPAWKLRAGVARETAAVVDPYRTPRLPDSDRMWYAVGAQWAMTPTMAIDVGFAYLRMDRGSSALPNQETATGLPRGSLVGSYEPDAKILAVQARYSF